MSDMSVTPSGLTGAGGGDKLRIVGMSTGLDVDGMVEKMSKSHLVRIGQEQIKLQLAEWKQEAYRDVITDIKAFQDEFFNSLKTSSLMTREGNYNAFTIDGIDSTIVKATATSNAVEGQYEVIVTSVAEGAKMESILPIKTIENADASLVTKLSDIGISNNDTFKFKVSYMENGQPVELEKSIGLTEDETISSFVKKINIESNGKVAAAFDEISGKLIIKTTGTGESSKFQIQELNSITEKLGINDLTEVSGSPAKFSIKSPYGGTKEIVQDSNSYSINGISFSIQGKIGTTTFEVKSDVEPTMDLIKGFIEKYNSLVEKIQSKLTTKRNNSYKPLTDVQKKQMSKDEIEKWEARGKEGILNSDPIISEMIQKIRRSFFDGVEGAGINFGREIGLDTTNDYKSGGKIVFTNENENKLREVLTSKRKNITDLFTQRSDDYNNKGIFTRIDEILQEFVGRTGTSLNSAKLTSIANKQNNNSSFGLGTGNTMPDQIQRQNVIIKKLNAKMAADREKYYKQFSVLESAMQKLNSQSAWLYQQLGG